MLPLLIFPGLVHAQTDSPTMQDEAQIAQEVLGSMNAEPVTPQEAFDNIAKFGISDRESSALDAFSLASEGNLALIRQVGSGNEAHFQQSGAANLSVLVHLGDGNLTTAYQTGSGNILGVRIEGRYNGLDVVQEGTDNMYLLDYAGDGQNINPGMQIGNNNQAVQLGRISAPFGVQQHGDGMRMIIRHNTAQ